MSIYSLSYYVLVILSIKIVKILYIYIFFFFLFLLNEIGKATYYRNEYRYLWNDIS